MPAPAPCAGPCINTSPPAERELGSSFHSFLYFPGLSALRAPRTSVFGALTVCGKTCAESNPLETGRGSSRGSRPPHLGANAPGALPYRPSGERRISSLVLPAGVLDRLRLRGRKFVTFFPLPGENRFPNLVFAQNQENGLKKGTLRQKSTGLRGDPADDSWFSKIFQKKTPGRV